MPRQLYLFDAREPEPEMIRFRSGRTAIYMGGFDTGGGTFEELQFDEGGAVITVPWHRFLSWFESGRVTWVKTPKWWTRA